MTELLPCPFCGLAPRVIEDTQGHDFQIFCVCEAEPCFSVPKADRERAILAWNTRPSPSTRMADVTLGAEAMLDAKAGEFKGSTPCDCRYGCCYHKDGPKGAGWYQTSDCPIHGEPSQGEGAK